MHSVLSKKNSKFRAANSGMEHCTTSHVRDSPVDLHIAATLHLEINQYEGSRVIYRSGGLSLAFRAVARVRCQCSPYGMCGEHSDTGTGLSLSRAVSFLPSLLSFNKCCTFSLLLPVDGQ